MSRIAKGFFYGLAGFLVLATLLPLFRGKSWWIRIFDFPRLQIAVLCLAVMAAALVFWKARSWAGGGFLALLALSAVYQFYHIYPYTPLAAQQVLKSRQAVPASSFSLLISNVMMENRQAEGFLESVRREDPDMILATEPDRWWIDRLKVLEEEYPYRVQYPLDNTYGMALYSRLKLIDPRVQFLVEPYVPSIQVRVEMKNAKWFELICLHPEPPHPIKEKSTIERDIELLMVAESVKGVQWPVVVAGDLNDVAWSRTTRRFQRISGLLDPRVGRGLYNTFEARIPFLRFPLDHIFHSGDFKLIQLKRLSFFGSDHFPIYIKLSYEPEGKRP